MTHDELKAYINHYGKLEPFFVDAMLAVVEIHKPDEFNTHCRGCEAIPYESCPTIQAIQEQLK